MNRAPFTAPKNHHQGLESLAMASRVSICEPFVDKAYGIHDRDWESMYVDKAETA